MIAKTCTIDGNQRYSWMNNQHHSSSAGRDHVVSVARASTDVEAHILSLQAASGSALVTVQGMPLPQSGK
jgi:hypothetical protein